MTRVHIFSFVPGHKYTLGENCRTVRNYGQRTVSKIRHHGEQPTWCCRCCLLVLTICNAPTNFDAGECVLKSARYRRPHGNNLARKFNSVETNMKLLRVASDEH